MEPSTSLRDFVLPQQHLPSPKSLRDVLLGSPTKLRRYGHLERRKKREIVFGPEFCLSSGEHLPDWHSALSEHAKCI